MSHYTYSTTAEDPSIVVDWRDFANNVFDLSSGTFSFRLVSQDDDTVCLTKSSGISGYATLQGSSPDQYNCVIQWSTGELATVTGGTGEFRGILQHTVSSRMKEFPGVITVTIKTDGT